MEKRKMKIVVLIALLIISACSPRQSLVGTWKAGGYSWWERGNAILHQSGLERWNMLIIKRDSSWQIEGSCQVFAGSKWKTTDDSLLLFPDTCWGTNNPALNRSKSYFDGGYLAYKIKPRCLERRSKVVYKETDKHGSLKQRSANFLEKLEPVK
ncbi:MAG: hypothetical protein ABI763_06025 [Bacteroidota bacterium]